MTDDLFTRRGTRGVKPAVAASHKFAVGVRVSYTDRSGSRLYRVTRQLPDGGNGLQYRIRSDQDGLERVVVEFALQQAK